MVSLRFDERRLFEPRWVVTPMGEEGGSPRGNQMAPPMSPHGDQARGAPALGLAPSTRQRVPPTPRPKTTTLPPWTMGLSAEVTRPPRSVHGLDGEDES